MNEIFSVKDQVVVITGGTGVLGRCIGEYLATQGAKVVLMGRRKDEGDEIVAGITAKGGEAMFLVTDVMDQKVVEDNCKEWQGGRSSKCRRWQYERSCHCSGSDILRS